jgi:SAM-dependent methyltransferase
MTAVTRFWNESADAFDTIYTGKKSRLARWLDRIFRADMYGRMRWVFERSGDVSKKTVCDIGCGSGRFVVEFARKGASRVTGIDVAPKMLALAGELVASAGVQDRCDFHHADILNWRGTEQYDITVAIGFWDYIEDPSERLRIIRRITKQQFLSSWPRFWTWRVPVRKMRLGALGCPVYFFRRKQLYRLMESAGFEVTSFAVVGNLFCVEARPR